MKNTYKPNYTIAGIGELLWDCFERARILGGAPANFAYHCHALGACSEVVSCVGNDKSGRDILAALTRLGLKDRYVYRDDLHDTGTVDISLDEGGLPSFSIHKDVAWDYIPFNDSVKQFAGQVDAVCFGTLAQRSSVSKQTIRSFVNAMPEKSLRVLDMNLRGSFYDANIIRSCLRLANCVKLNNEELPVVADLLNIPGSENDILEYLINEYDLILLALTKGKKGSRLIGLDEDSTFEAPQVPVVDTVGAGDAFTAAMVIGFLENYPIPVIHKKAIYLAAYVCTRQGATPVISREVLDSFYSL